MKNKYIRFKAMNLSALLGVVTLMAVALAPNASRGCACGCGVFDVGTSSMFPDGPGGMFTVGYDYMDQIDNWHGDSRAPAANNADQEIRTHFVNMDFQYMFNRAWGVMVEMQYENRFFSTVGGPDGKTLENLNWGGLGDTRIKGVYTGFSPDLSGALTFGVKLPTGSYNHNDAWNDIDRDTSIGTGSTDILLGGFFRHNLTSSGGFVWFSQAELDLPVLIQNQYRPGIELDAAFGAYYKGWSVGGVKIHPLAEIIGSEKTSDTGANSAHPVASGYQRILLAPGVEFDRHPFKFFAQIDFTAFEETRGNQMVAPWMVKAAASFMF